MRRKRVKSLIVKNEKDMHGLREGAEQYTTQLNKKPLDATPMIKNAIVNRSKYSMLKQARSREAQETINEALRAFPVVEGEEETAKIERLQKHLETYGVRAVKKEAANV